MAVLEFRIYIPCEHVENKFKREGGYSKVWTIHEKKDAFDFPQRKVPKKRLVYGVSTFQSLPFRFLLNSLYKPIVMTRNRRKKYSTEHFKLILYKSKLTYLSPLCICSSA